MDFGKFPKAVIKENADYTVREITNVIKKYGPRDSGNENCFATQKHLKKELDQFCDETHFEEYQLAPKGYLGFTKTVPIISILAIVILGALAFTNIIAFSEANLVLALVTAFLLCVSLIHNPLSDKIRKKVTGHNLVASRKPRAEIKKRIILVGNVDAPYEQSLVRRFKKKSYSKFTHFGLYTLILTECVALISLILPYINFEFYNKFVDEAIKYVYFAHIITVIFLIKMLFAVDFKTVSPGANDNLTGAYSAVGALRMLDMAGIDFENTEVVAVITDGKEAGAKGAISYVEAHKDELKDNTYVLAIQSLSTENPQLLNRFKKTTDALPFARAGVKTALLSAEDNKADYYHNRRDNAEVLNQKAIEIGFSALLEEMFKFDEE